ncbi:MAG: LysM domain-containing protein [Moritella sp.]|uniref:LysM peptidoglycan-binding domain-containing protein n=1 Tax=Moritella sp. TaxID=78556 RepID=UPI0029BF48CF|nr:LysM domain-containing protein [Moritella sp.]MDX2319174.1 LysM domain-containing protein [Moritella sp.]
MSIKRRLIFALAAILPFLAHADSLNLKNQYPTEYTVKEGDTLWDISSKYLQSPWLWPQLWDANPELDDPHLIYPGDKLQLIFVDGQPRLVRNQMRKRIIKVSPQARSELKGNRAIPTVPLKLVNSFLSRDYVATDDKLQQAPVILGNNDGNTTFLVGHNIFASSSLKPGQYGIYRHGRTYIDPVTNEKLGNEVEFIAIARVVNTGTATIPAKLAILKSAKEARKGDRLIPMPEQERLPVYFQPRSFQLASDGVIVAADEKHSAIGKSDVVIINRGWRDSVGAGDVFAVLKRGKTIIRDEQALNFNYDDQVNQYDKLFSDKNELQLPDERIGEMMVFKVYDKVSLALITRSSQVIKLNDKVSNL